MAKPQEDEIDGERRRAFSQALSEAIRAKDLTLEGLAARLSTAGAPASPATLSYWQNGHSVPTRGRSMEVVRVLEHILDLPSGSLTRHLTKGGKLDWHAPQVVPIDQEVDQVLAEWGLDLKQRFTPIAVMSHTILSPADSMEVVIRQVMRVESEVERAMPVILVADDGTPPEIRAIHGCTLGRFHRGSENGVSLGELVLPRPLGHGETFWLEYSQYWGIGETLWDSTHRRQPAITGLLSLDLTFEGKPPEAVFYYTEPADRAPRAERRITMSDGLAQVVVQNAGPGVHGLRW